MRWLVPLLLALPAAAQLPPLEPCQPSSFSSTVVNPASTDGYASVTCTPCVGPWEDCTYVTGDGLTYLDGVIDEAGVTLRWNDAPGQSAALVVHGGGGGLTWKDTPRDLPLDDTDLADLESRGCRVIGVKWFDTGLSPPDTPEPGWWSRRGPQAEGFVRLSRRPAGLFAWAGQEGPMAGLQQGFMGSSGGGAAVMGLAIHGLEHALEPAYWGLHSTAPFWDEVSGCLQTTPPGTFVNEATGALGSSGAGAALPDPQVCDIHGMVDHVFALPYLSCENKTLPADLIGDQGDGCFGRTFTGRAQFSVATVAGPGICGGNDSGMGITWTQGQAFNLSAWQDKTWQECQGQHGDAMRPEESCFDVTHAEIVAALGLEGEPPGPSCGDGNCDPGEDCSSCPADCGACPPGGGPLYIASFPDDCISWDLSGNATCDAQGVGILDGWGRIGIAVSPTPIARDVIITAAALPGSGNGNAYHELAARAGAGLGVRLRVFPGWTASRMRLFDADGSLLLDEVVDGLMTSRFPFSLILTVNGGTVTGRAIQGSVDHTIQATTEYLGSGECRTGGRSFRSEQKFTSFRVDAP